MQECLGFEPPRHRTCASFRYAEPRIEMEAVNPISIDVTNG